MKNILFFLVGSLFITALSGCSDDVKNNHTEASKATEVSSLEVDDTKHSGTKVSNINNTNTSEIEITQDVLSKYTDEQIEYARVWNTLGVNQEIAELNILKIPAGTLIYPGDINSPTYPYDTIQLRGSRLIDGIITYKSNHDGSIDAYTIPARWEDSIKEELTEEFIQSLIDNRKNVQVEVGNSDDIEKLINLQIIH